MDTKLSTTKVNLTWLFLIELVFVFLFAREDYLIATIIFLSIISLAFVFSEQSNGLILLPFFLYMPIPISDGIQFSEIGTFIIILSFVFFILGTEHNLTFNVPAFLPLLLILIASCLSVVNARYPFASLKAILKYISAFIIIFYYTINFVNKKEIILKILMSFIVVGFLAACIGIFRYTEGYDSRASGLLGGGFGAFIGVSLLIAINMIIFSLGKTIKIFSLIVLPVLAAALILSQTRAWLVGFILAILFIFFHLIKGKKGIRFGLVLIPVALVTIMLLTSNVLTTSKSILISEGASKAFQTGLAQGDVLGRYVSVLMRMFVWLHGFQIYMNYPIFGFGIGNLRIKNFFTGELAHPADPNAGYIDNHWLNVWFETGILGIIGWIWFAVIILKNCKKLVKISTDPEWKLIALSLTGTMFIFLIGGIFWSLTVVHEMTTLIPFLIALIFASIHTIESEKETETHV